MITERLYKSIARPILFSFDPERAHHLSMGAAWLLSCSPMSEAIRSMLTLDDPCLEAEAFGLRFTNPLGLAAGFDKEAAALPFFSALGFGHIEAGTVTGQAQAGNPRPRLFRLQQDGAIINRLGFPSSGAEAVRPRFQNFYRRLERPILGANLGKTKAVPIEQAISDYSKSFLLLRDLADYFVLNISSPNTPDLRKLQEPERLRALFTAIRDLNSGHKPILIKVAPDMTTAELDAVLELCLEQQVSGILATNTTFSREGLNIATDESGGLSGPPLHARAVSIVGHIYRRTSGKLPIVGIGGISKAEDVIRFVRAGATLVQLYTALVYQGPTLIYKIKQDLIAFCRKEGLKALSMLRGQQN